MQKLITIVAVVVCIGALSFLLHETTRSEPSDTDSASATDSKKQKSPLPIPPPVSRSQGSASSSAQPNLASPRDAELSKRSVYPETVQQSIQHGLLGLPLALVDDLFEGTLWTKESKAKYRHKNGAVVEVSSTSQRVEHAVLILPKTLASPEVQIALNPMLGVLNSSPIDLEELMVSQVFSSGRLTTKLGLSIPFSSGYFKNDKSFLSISFGRFNDNQTDLNQDAVRP